MKLRVNLVVGGNYIVAGSELPEDFELPDHLKAFVIREEKESRRTPAAEEEEDAELRRMSKPSPWVERSRKTKPGSLRK